MYRRPRNGWGPCRARARHNLKMARFRIPVENLFAGVGQHFPLVHNKYQQKLGSMAVGEIFLVAGWLYNIFSIFNGNQMSQGDSHQVMQTMSLQEYLSLGHEDRMEEEEENQEEDDLEEMY